MNVWLWAVVGGLGGTVMMDTAGWIAGRLKFRWGG